MTEDRDPLVNLGACIVRESEILAINLYDEDTEADLAEGTSRYGVCISLKTQSIALLFWEQGAIAMIREACTALFPNMARVNPALNPTDTLRLGERIARRTLSEFIGSEPVNAQSGGEA